ncbi:MAG TPA: hypothetical protein P5077_05865 [bacterium]|nr:hypothetical protein [bacterium]
MRRELTAFFIFSMAILAVELSFTKVFSVILWYHFGFLIISTAMLGFAVAGVYLAVRGDELRAAPASLMTLAGGATWCAYALMTRVAAVSEALFPSRMLSSVKIVEMAVIVILLFLPFFFLGLTVARVIAVRRRDAGLYYGANLAGSAAGALLFLFLFDHFPGDIAVPLTVLLMFAAGLVIADRPRERAMAVVSAALTLPFLFIPGAFPLDPPRDKMLGFVKDPVAAVSYTGWSSLSKVDFVRDPDEHLAPGCGLWGISERFMAEGRPWPARTGIVIDSWAYTSMVHYPQDLSFYDYMPTTFAFALRPYDSSLHIGAGGGIDLLAARHYGVRSVQGVEINPVIVRTVAEKFGDRSGGIYGGGMPGVEVFVDEGRHFVERADRSWDLIQLSGVDTYSSTQAGAFALSENNLYTVEAFLSYYRKLNEGGMLTMTRWFAPDEELNLRYELRLLNIAREALLRLGVGVEGNIFYFVSQNYTLLTIKKGKFSEDEVARGAAFIEKNRFIPIIVPGRSFGWSRKFEDFLYAPPDAFDRMVAEYPYNVEPPTDDKPFYFEIRRFSTLLSGMLNPVAPFNELSGQTILLAVLAELALLGILLILLPLRWLARRGAISPAPSDIAYFSFIGLAFMLIEIALSQKLVLYLGHPVYALSVVIFSMLLFSGIGSVVCQRLSAVRRRSVLLFLPVVIAIVLFSLPFVTEATLRSGFPVRFFIAVLAGGLPAFFMGFPFPAGILRSGEREVPVFWGVNGFFSVVASVVAVQVSINLGFTAVFVLALLAYLAASALYLRRREG